jgi:hypothetical protein
MKPVVTVVVRNGEIVGTLMRPPGLRDGDHDLFVQPTALPLDEAERSKRMERALQGILRAANVPGSDWALVLQNVREALTHTAPDLPPRVDVCPECQCGNGDHWPSCTKAPE